MANLDAEQATVDAPLPGQVRGGVEATGDGDAAEHRHQVGERKRLEGGPG